MRPRPALARAEAEAKKATQDLARMQELKTAQAVSQDRVDSAQAWRTTPAPGAVLAARALLTAAHRSGRSGAVTRIEEARGQLRQSEPVNAMVAVAQRECCAGAGAGHHRGGHARAGARLQLSYTQILAPEDGVMTRLSAHEGQLVGPGQAIATLVPRALYIIANFKETQVGKMHEGQEVEVNVDSVLPAPNFPRAPCRAWPAAPARSSRCSRPTTRREIT